MTMNKTNECVHLNTWMGNAKLNDSDIFYNDMRRNMRETQRELRQHVRRAIDIWGSAKRS